jgi:L-fucose dehydrogenase
MELSLQNKVIVISGNTSSHFLDLISILSGEGAILIIVGTLSNETKLKLEKEISGSNTIWVEARLDHPEDCENAVRTVIQKYNRIDGLVNNSGIEEDSGIKDAQIFLENVQKNLVHYYLLTHFVLPYLKKSAGAIVNIGLNSSETGKTNSTARAATNGGINSLTREWAVELLKYRIRVNAVLAKEYIKEIGYAVAFLLSKKSSHTTGQLIRFGS